MSDRFPIKRVKHLLAAPLAYGVLKPDKYDGADRVRLFRIVDVGSSGLVDQSDIEFISPSQSQEFRRTLLMPGDVVLSVVGTLGRAFIADESHRGANLSRALARIQLRPETERRFFFYWLQSIEFETRVDITAQGTAQRVLNLSDLKEFELPVPIRAVQRAIADFLDRKTTAIDALIAKKERLLELLAEKRQSLITQAVTKGLDPNVPMKDSGVEWIGRIPVSWAVGQLGRFITLQRGIDITGASDTTHGYPVISSGGISGRTPKAASRGPGVVIGRKGTLGKVFFCEEDYWPHDTTLWVKDFKKSCPKFVFHFLKHLRLERLDTGAANPTLNRNLVHPIMVSWPDPDSQKRIASFLDTQTMRDEMIASVYERSITKLREYRQALITAAVTGQIDIGADTQEAA